MARTVECEVWVLVSSEGEWECGPDADSARAHFADNVGALEEQEGFRMVKVTVRVPLPEVVELTGEAPATGQAALVSVS